MRNLMGRASVTCDTRSSKKHGPANQSRSSHTEADHSGCHSKVWTTAAESTQSRGPTAPKATVPGGLVQSNSWWIQVTSEFENRLTFKLIKSPLRDKYNFLMADYRFWNQPRQEDKYMVCLRKRQGKYVFHTSLFKRKKKKKSKVYQKYIHIQVTCRLPPHLKSSKILIWTRQYFKWDQKHRLI